MGLIFFGMNLTPSYFRFSVCLVFVSLTTYLISYVTMLFIERPFIKAGSYVAENYLILLPKRIFSR